MTELRSIRLHDLPLVYRLAGHGVSFDVQLSLLSRDDGLRQVMLSRTGRVQVYVLRQASASALAQLRFLDDPQLARLAYIAPALEESASEALWLDLLDGLTVMAGQRGIASILAEVERDAAEALLLRHAGYVTYAQQDLWRRAPSPAPAVQGSVRRAAASDSAAVMALYNLLVPGLVRPVEPPPLAADACYVLDNGQELWGAVAVYASRPAVLLEAYFLPDPRSDPAALLNAVLAQVRAESRPVYFRVRDYMGCRAGLLTSVGFEHVAEQALMVRHTAVRIVHHAYSLSASVEGGMPLPTSNVDLK